MGHSGIKTGRKVQQRYLFNTTERYSHIQPFPAPLLHVRIALEKQPEKPDHSSLADFDCEIR